MGCGGSAVELEMPSEVVALILVVSSMHSGIGVIKRGRFRREKKAN